MTTVGKKIWEAWKFFLIRAYNFFFLRPCLMGWKKNLFHTTCWAPSDFNGSMKQKFFDLTWKFVFQLMISVSWVGYGRKKNCEQGRKNIFRKPGSDFFLQPCLMGWKKIYSMQLAGLPVISMGRWSKIFLTSLENLFFNLWFQSRGLARVAKKIASKVAKIYFASLDQIFSCNLWSKLFLTHPLSKQFDPSLPKKISWTCLQIFWGSS